MGKDDFTASHIMLKQLENLHTLEEQNKRNDSI